MNDFNLDVDTPEKVVLVLRAAAQAYRESEIELQEAWQDENAGKEWLQIARILEKAANRIENLLKHNP